MTESKYQLFPEIPPDDYAALKADIAKRGVLVPVEYDDEGEILDGHHRVRAHTELIYEGVDLEPYPRVIREGWTEVQKRSHVRNLNILRRHLTQEQKRELIRDQVRETPERSNRQIGTSLGVDHKTVGSERERLESSGEIPQIEKRTVERGGQTYTQQTTNIGRSQPTRHTPDPDIVDDYVEDVCQDQEAIAPPSPMMVSVLTAQPNEPPVLAEVPRTVDVSSLNLPSMDPSPEERLYHAVVRASTAWTKHDPVAVAATERDDGHPGLHAETVDAFGDWIKAVASALRARRSIGIRAVK